MFNLLGFASFISVAIAAQSSHTAEPPATAIQLKDFPRPNTSVKEWLSQEQGTPPEDTAIAEITSIRVSSNNDGIEITLETSNRSQFKTQTREENNTLIIEIDRTNLALGQPFRQNQPGAGIQSVQAIQLPSNRIEVRIVGETDVPFAEIRQSATGLVLGVTPADDAEEEVVVTATRREEPLRDVPRSITIISREQIQQQSQFSRNLPDILTRLIPGTNPPNGRLGNLTLRGRDTSVLIDGVPQNTNNNQTFGSGALIGIDPENIERIEVISGANAIYGSQATGGLINIVTRRPSQNRLTSTTEIGLNRSLTNSDDSLGYLLSHQFSIRQDTVDVTAGFSIATQGGLYDAAGDRIGNNFNLDNTTTLNGLLNLGVDLDKQQRLQFRFNHSRVSQDPGFINDESIVDIPGIQKGRLIRRPEGTQIIGYRDGLLNSITNLSLNYSHTNLFNSQVQGLIFYRRFATEGFIPFDNRLFDGTTISDQAGRTEQLGGRLQIDTPLNAQRTVSLLWGVDYDRQRINQDSILFDPDEFDASGGRIFRRIGQVPYVPLFTFNDLGVFAQLQAKLGDRFTLSGGTRYVNLRASVDDYQTANLFSSDPPRDIQGGTLSADGFVFNLGATYNITNQLSAFASFSQGFSFPDIARILREPPEGFVSLSGSTDSTEPVRVNNYEIGLRGNWNTVQASIAGFYSFSRLGFDAVFNEGEGGLLRNVRAPRRIYGIEGSLNWQATRTLTLGGTVGWIEGENDEDEDGDFQPLDSGVINPLKLTAYVDHQTSPGWRNRLQFLYSGNRSRAFNAGVDGQSISNYLTVDFISTIKVGRGELVIGVQNLFNTEYFPVYSQAIAPFFDPLNYTGQGRTLSIGYRITY